jgi:hypothetical protein
VAPNTFGVVVNELSDLNPDGHYTFELARTRVWNRRDLEFYSLSDLVQYFASIGGFDCVLSLLKLG